MGTLGRRARYAMGGGLIVVLIAGAVAGTWLLWPRTPLVTRAEATRLLITNVRVLDVVDGTLSEPRDVLVDRGVIEHIVPAGSGLAATRTLDGAGATLMPGLIDSHCHIGASTQAPWSFGVGDPDLNMERLLYSGVTRAFDPGAPTPDAFDLRAQVASGERLGPTLYTAGPIFTAVDGHPAPMLRLQMPGFVADHIIPKMTRQIADEADARREVGALVPMQPDFIKLALDRIPLEAPELTPELTEFIVIAAQENGLRSVAHIGTTRNAKDAAEAGVSAWIHGVYKERIPDEDIPLLAAYGIPMTPTLVVFKSYAEVGHGEFEATDLERELVSADQLDSYLRPPDGYEQPEEPAAFLRLLREQRANALDNVRRLHAAGVTILAGSDAQPTVIHGPSLHRELALLRQAGLSPIEVVRAATLYPARFFADSADPHFGIVAAGKEADLILVRGNPLDDLGAVSRIEAVVLRGRLLERHPLRP